MPAGTGFGAATGSKGKTTMPPAVTICKDGDDLAAHAADLIVQAAQTATRARGRAMLALAGGSTPEKTYSALAQPGHRIRIDWVRTFLFLGDERFVPPDDPSSNFAMVQRTLLAPVSAPAGHAFSVPTQLGTAAAAASAYAAALTEAFGIGKVDGPPRFDLILLGLGEDGHTASLFPGAASLSVTDRWVVASPPGTLPPPVERITLTFPVLNAAREIVFLVSGQNKAEALRDVLEGNPSREQRPAVWVRPVDGTLTWLVDEGAASRLTRRGSTPIGARRDGDARETGVDDGRTR
ncbi:MAG TPA: 6-phosphogluconolactonase [Thermoanaerobaculaceae bacterium]|nr:6-phosphogluconolactonase [Thermoanaerobaculaceae bacterium]